MIGPSSLWSIECRCDGAGIGAGGGFVLWCGVASWVAWVRDLHLKDWCSKNHRAHKSTIWYWQNIVQNWWQSTKLKARRTAVEHFLLPVAYTARAWSSAKQKPITTTTLREIGAFGFRTEPKTNNVDQNTPALDRSSPNDHAVLKQVLEGAAVQRLCSQVQPQWPNCRDRALTALGYPLHLAGLGHPGPEVPVTLTR